MFARNREFGLVYIRLQVQQATHVGRGYVFGTFVYGILHFASCQFGGYGLESGGKHIGMSAAYVAIFQFYQR